MSQEDNDSKAREPKLIRSHTQLDVYKTAYSASMELFRLSKSFPEEERYSLTSQMRRSTRSVSANLAEAWRKRRYEAAFINKLTDSEAEAAESQTWISYAVDCEYLDREIGRRLYKEYEKIIGMLVTMENNADKFTVQAT